MINLVSILLAVGVSWLVPIYESTDSCTTDSSSVEEGISHFTMYYDSVSHDVTCHFPSRDGNIYTFQSNPIGFTDADSVVNLDGRDKFYYTFPDNFFPDPGVWYVRATATDRSNNESAYAPEEFSFTIEAPEPPDTTLPFQDLFFGDFDGWEPIDHPNYPETNWRMSDDSTYVIGDNNSYLIYPIHSKDTRFDALVQIPDSTEAPYYWYFGIAMNFNSLVEDPAAAYRFRIFRNPDELDNNAYIWKRPGNQKLIGTNLSFPEDWFSLSLSNKVFPDSVLLTAYLNNEEVLQVADTASNRLENGYITLYGNGWFDEVLLDTLHITPPDTGLSSIHWFGDVNDDCIIDGLDQMILSAHKTHTVGKDAVDITVDLNHDGYIDGLDQMIMSANKGKRCP